jgi:transposase
LKGFPDAVTIGLKAGEQRRFAMRKPIALRADFDAVVLRRIARASRDADQVRRLLALAAIYDGASRTQGGVTLQVVRDWVVRFNALGPEGLVDRKAPGQLPRLNDEHRAALAKMVENGPIPAEHGVVRWRIIDLCQWIWEEFEIRVSKQTLSRELRAMDYRKLSARPRHHAQAPGAIEDFKKMAHHGRGDRATAWPRSRRGRNLVRRRSQGWSEGQDHPPLGQARQPPVGSLGPAHRLHVHLWRHLSQAGQGGRLDPALVQHGDDEPAFGSDLRRYRSQTPCCAVARPSRLAPDNITIVPLPPKCPEINAQENVWQFMRDNWLSNSVFDTAADLLNHCSDAWNNLEAQPWTVMSLGIRDWAHGF